MLQVFVHPDDKFEVLGYLLRSIPVLNHDYQMSLTKMNKSSSQTTVIIQYIRVNKFNRLRQKTMKSCWAQSVDGECGQHGTPFTGVSTMSSEIKTSLPKNQNNVKHDQEVSPMVGRCSVSSCCLNPLDNLDIPSMACCTRNRDCWLYTPRLLSICHM